MAVTARPASVSTAVSALATARTDLETNIAANKTEYGLDGSNRQSASRAVQMANEHLRRIKQAQALLAAVNSNSW
jgi:hypothetical protein